MIRKNETFADLPEAKDTYQEKIVLKQNRYLLIRKNMSNGLSIHYIWSIMTFSWVIENQSLNHSLNSTEVLKQRITGGCNYISPVMFNLLRNEYFHNFTGEFSQFGHYFDLVGLC